MKFLKLIFIFLLLLTSENFSNSFCFAQTASFSPREDSSDDVAAPQEKKIKANQPKAKSKMKNLGPKRDAQSPSFELFPSIVASLDGKRVYQLDQKNNEVKITDFSNKQGGENFSVKLYRTPVAITVSPSLPLAYVVTAPKAAENHGALYTVGAKGNQYQALGDPILLGKNPSAIAASSDGKKVYVAHIDELQDEQTFTTRGALFVFGVEQNPDQLTLQSALGIPQSPSGIAVAPDNHALYLIDRGGKNNPSGMLTAVELNPLKIVSQIEIGEDPYAVSVSPDGNFVYVAYSGKKQLAVVDVSSYPIQKVMEVSLEQSPILFGTFHSVPSSLTQ